MVCQALVALAKSTYWKVIELFKAVIASLVPKAASEVINRYIKYLGEGILNFCNIFRPEAIVLSGGIAQQGKNLLDPLIDYCEKRDYGFKGTPKVKITTAQLGYDSGIFGAASLFLNNK